MAVSDSSKVDLLYKKLFGVTKTDTSTNKGAGNESIASPALIRGDKVWTDAASIPGTAADVTNVVQSYLTTSRIECTADTTTTPVSSVYPTWKTNLTNWISPEFGSTYFVKVYAETAGNANPTNGISLSDSGSGGTGEWYFDYQSGVLNFIGGTIPAALTAAKVIYITGYRYIGTVGITNQTNAGTATTANVAYTANIANTVLTLSNFTTANLAESTNQYFTNARVAANLELQSINVFTDVNITGITTNGILTWNGTAFVAGTVGGATSNSALVAYQADHANTADNSNVANSVLSISNFTTANLAEGINLYYTNSRVVSIVTPYLTTANVVESQSNLYYTNARVYAAIQGNLSTKANVADLTTANVVESASNLYYTNARVYSNVVALLPTLAGSGIQIQANGQINANAQALSLTTLAPFLTTSNVAEGSNLYYTNARVVSAIIPYLTTSNVAEGSNLYYTNARVLSALTGNLVIGNLVTGTSVSNSYVTAGNVTAGNLIATTLVLGSAVGGSITGANLISANNIQGVNWIGLYTSNVVEGTNQYFTNARVYSNVIGFLPSLAGSGIQIQANGQINANAQALSLTTLAPFLTTSNVSEGSNLYYTNARVLANVSQMSINVFADVDLTGIQTSGILIWNGTAFVSGTVSAAAASNTALIAYQADHANTADNSNVANSVLSLTGLTTSNLLEGTNLYFTNTRAAIGLTGLNVSVNDLYAAGNLTIQGDFTTLNVATLNIEDKNITLGKGLTSSAQADGAGISVDGAQANITYLVSGDKFNINKNVEILGDIKANTWTGLYTGNISESTNQYFTNARTILAITPYLTTSNVTEVNNLYYTNARVSSNLELQSINVFADVDISGINNDELLIWNSTARKFYAGSLANKLTTANVVELTNLYFTNARVFSALSDGTANLTFYNLTTNGLLTVSSGTTDETVAGIEFKNNPGGGAGDTAKIKYYAANIGVNDDTILEISVANNIGDSINLKTTGGGVGVNVARPVAEFDVGGNVNVRNSLIFSSLITGPSATFNVVTSNTWNNLYTANVQELTNLYYTNARVLSFVTPYLTTANVLESASNLYYTNSRVYAAIQGNLATKANVVDLTTANVSELTNLYYTNARVLSFVTPYLTTANVTELTNLYYTNARVISAVTPYLTTSNVVEGSNQYFTNARAILAVTPYLTTANVLESSSNLYYTDIRANAAFDARLSNKSTNDLGEGTNLYYTNTRVLSALTGNVTIGNLKVSTALNYSNTTGVTKVYQYYNESTQSLDTIFL